MKRTEKVNRHSNDVEAKRTIHGNSFLTLIIRCGMAGTAWAGKFVLSDPAPNRTRKYNDKLNTLQLAVELVVLLVEGILAEELRTMCPSLLLQRGVEHIRKMFSNSRHANPSTILI